MDEFEFIEKITPKSYHQATIKGIGDDAAVLSLSQEKTVIAMDTFVEGVHFIKDKTISPYLLGKRILTANLSDLAAMGARPVSYLVSVTKSSDWSNEELLDCFEGMRDLGNTYQMDLIGGDTVSAKVFSLTITIIGQTNRVRYRHEAKPGDIIFVTGTLGDSRAGLEILLNDLNNLNEKHSYLIERHQEPTARLEFSNNLSKIARLCLNDVSDGLSSELNEIAQASHVNLIIDESLIPVSKSLMDFNHEKTREWKLAGGEDYELLGSSCESNWQLIKEEAEKMKVKVTKIGVVADKTTEPKVYLKEGESLSVLKSKGYNHFK